MSGTWFSWNKNVDDVNIDSEALFKNVNWSIDENEYIGIIGNVGCGKTSFLLSILREMFVTKGCLKVSQDFDTMSIAFVSEKPWLIKRSIRENIVMFKDYDPVWYSKVILACGLDKDFLNMRMGDMTEVADEGVSLSGGQKSRICLARAVYHRSKLYLLDDPLSSLDMKVAKMIVEEVISKLLSNATIIMVSHNVHLFTKFKSTIRVPNRMFHIKNGYIEQCGYEENETYDSQSEVIFEAIVPKNIQQDDVSVILPFNFNYVEDVNGCYLKDEEHIELGSINQSVYFGYMKLVGIFLTSMILISIFLMQASKNSSEYWLSYWSSAVSKNSSQSSHIYNLLVWSPSEMTLLKEIKAETKEINKSFTYFLTIYLIIVFINIIASVIRAFSFAYGGIKASYHVHKKLLSALIRAKLEFFEQTPRGRILNRFTSDLSTIDDNLPFVFNIFLANIFTCIGCLLIVTISLPAILAIIIPLICICYYYQYFYRMTSRAIKRLISVNRSPLYSNFTEMIEGMIFIRNFRSLTHVMNENKVLLLNLIKCEYSGLLLSSWLSIRLQIIGIVFVTIIILMSLTANHFSSINKGLIGLACVYSFTLTNILSGVIIYATESEKEFVAVERCLEYIPSKHNKFQIPFEDTKENEYSDDRFGDFDKNGDVKISVEFRNIYLRYVSNDRYALSNISLKIHTGCNVGVIGRTGSGKSSLIKLLFRLVTFEDNLLINERKTGYNGEILINGIETRNINLHSLRSRISFMLQDSVIFTGTMRHNLDPNNHYNDEDLLNVSKKLHFETYFSDYMTPSGIFNLNSDISNQGRELSYGQQQLLSLGRILLSSNMIVCLDEPSSHMDILTESIIEDIISSEFRQKTVIIIGHRLPMLLKLCDYILILDNGKVLEYGPINELLQNHRSHFTSILNDK